jgi:hypothetical protein
MPSHHNERAVDNSSLENPRVCTLDLPAIEMDRALYRFVSDDSSERRYISLHPVDISWDCILQLFGIKNALCSAQQAVRVQQALWKVEWSLREGSMVYILRVEPSVSLKRHGIQL